MPMHDDSDHLMTKSEKKRLREDERRRKFLQAYAAHHGVQLAPIAVGGFRAKSSKVARRHSHHSWTPRKSAAMKKVAAALLREEEAEYGEEEEEEEVFEYQHEYETEHIDDREVEHNHVNPQAERIVPEEEEWMKQYAPQQQQQQQQNQQQQPQQQQQQPSFTDHRMENWMAHFYPTTSQQRQHSPPTNSHRQQPPPPSQSPSVIAYPNMRQEDSAHYYSVSARHAEPQQQQPQRIDSVQRHDPYDATADSPVFGPEPSLTMTSTYSHQTWYALILVGMALLFLSECYQFCPFLASVTASTLIAFATGRLTAVATTDDNNSW